MIGSPKALCVVLGLAAIGLVVLGLAAIGLLPSPRPSWAGDEPKKPSPNSTAASQPGKAPRLDSVTNELDLDDMQKFRPGRPKDEILKELHWAGDLEMATEERGKSLAAISFYVYLKGASRGETLWAVFVDDKFTKFVEEPEYSIPIPVGTFEALRRVRDQKSIVFDEYKRQMIEYDEFFAKHYDPFLTKLAKKMVPEIMATHKRLEEENAPFRDRFNAARLKLGMTKGEVAAMLKGKPLDSGKMEAGTFEVYGSTVDLSIWSRLHYHSIVALYRDDRLAGIYSGLFAPGGREGLSRLRKPSGKIPAIFIGLPSAEVKPD